MRIVLSYQSGTPIYEQVKEQIKAAILAGEVKEDEPLPSIRLLARELKVSVMTTTRAYGDLEAEGFVHTLPKKGVYASRIDEGAVREQYKKEAREALQIAVQRGRAAGMAQSELHRLLDTVGDEIL